jgi:WD40 repeat protein
MIVLDSELRDIRSLAFSPSGRDLAVSNSWQVHVWRGLPAARSAVYFESPSGDHWVFSPDGSRLFRTSDRRSQPVVLDVEPPTKTSLLDGPKGHHWFHCTEQGGFILVAHGKKDFSRLDFASGQSGALMPTWTVQNERNWQGSSRFVGSICREGKQFVGIETRGRRRGHLHWEVDWELMVRSTTTGAVESRAKLPNSGYLRTAIFSPAGDCFVHLTGMKMFVYSFPQPERPPLCIRNDNRKHFTGAAFHPSGAYLAAASNDTTVKLYETRTWQVARLFSWEVGRLGAVAFSPDGCQGAVGAHTGKVVVWDVDL